MTESEPADSDCDQDRLNADLNVWARHPDHMAFIHGWQRDSQVARTRTQVLRNHGYGRKMEYAGRQTLYERHGGGSYRTQHDQAQRWGQFAAWVKEQGVRDARDVTPAHVAAYGCELVDQGYSAATCHNAASAVNSVMNTLRDGAWDRVSPAEATGLSRSEVREVEPPSRDQAEAAIEALRDEQINRAASVAELAHELGVRMEEAAKADLDRLREEADRDPGPDQDRPAVNMQEGTKGGRDADRWVPVSSAADAAIDRALEARPESSADSLIAAGETWQQFRDGELRDARDTLQEHGVTGYHDLRAAYACERYEQEAGAAAPVIAGARGASKTDDWRARDYIAYELGHNRADVARSYVGSSK